MKLSKTTLEILKNFSVINPNILLNPGNRISTLAEAKNIMASATIAENIPRQAGIFDLTQFLSTVSLLESPELEFTESCVLLKDEDTSAIEYRYSRLDVLTFPTKEVQMPTADVQFTLSANTLGKIRRAASVLGHSKVEIAGAEGKISAQVVDKENASANKYSIVLDGENVCKNVFSFIFPIDNLKILAGDYRVEISSRLISKFINTSVPVEYWIAMDKTSTFSK